MNMVQTETLTTIKAKHPGFEKLSWLLRATDKSMKDYKPFMYQINVAEHGGNTYAACTDGRRLHMWTNPPLKPGSYQILKNTKAEIQLRYDPNPEALGMYPNIWRVIPKKTAYQFTLELWTENPTKISQELFNIAQLGICLDYRYLEALSGFDFRFYTQQKDGKPDPDKSVVFRGRKENLYAVVMPINVH